MTDAAHWERIPTRGLLTCWRMRLAHPMPGVEVFLAVCRISADRWAWRLRGPEFDEPGGFRIHDQGESGTVAGAKRAAVRAVLEPHCPGCDTALDTGTPDIFHCPQCGDEWHPSTWPHYRPDTTDVGR